MSHSLLNPTFFGGNDNNNDGKTHVNEASITPISKHLLLNFAGFGSSKKPVFCWISLGGKCMPKSCHANSHFLPVLAANFLTKLVGQRSSHHQQFKSMHPALRKRSVVKTGARNGEQHVSNRILIQIFLAVQFLPQFF